MSDTTINSSGRALYSRPISVVIRGFLSRMASLVLSLPRLLLQSLIRWQRRADARYRIRELDERLLRDVGLTNDDLKEELEKPFWSA